MLFLCDSFEGGGCFWLNKMEMKGKQSHCDIVKGKERATEAKI